MDPKTLKETFLRRYLEGKGVTEYEVLFDDETLFKQIIKEFGEWSKFEKEVGILKRHIKERDKFELYWKMKLREERFGEEALRHKNIEEELKKNIQEAFGSVKYLTDNLVKKNQKEAIIYEAHAYILSGGDPTAIKEDNIQLYAAIVKDHDNIESFFEEYARHFILNPLEIALREKEQREMEQSESQFDINELVRMGYISEEQAQELREKRKQERIQTREA